MTAEQASVPQPAANENVLTDQDLLDLEALAKAVLDRRIRPRVGSIRRLAEGVLARNTTPAPPQAGAPKEKKKKKSKAGRASGGTSKKARGKKAKLARIPGQAAK